MTRPYNRRQARPESPRPAAPRDPDAAARLEARTAALLQSVDMDTTGADEFFIDLDAVPEGWCYEWKRNTLLNQEDPSYQVELARMGWEPVPAERHPDMMPRGYRGVVIERKGMILMERPQEITDMIRRRDDKEARSRVQGMEDRLSGSPQGHFERSNKDQPLARIKRTVEPMEIPD